MDDEKCKLCQPEGLDPYEPKHLERWTRPPCYFGAVWPAYYSSSVEQHRDSDALTRSNFACMLTALGGDPKETRTRAKDRRTIIIWLGK